MRFAIAPIRKANWDRNDFGRCVVFAMSNLITVCCVIGIAERRIGVVYKYKPLINYARCESSFDNVDNMLTFAVKQTKLPANKIHALVNAKFAFFS